MPAEGDSWRIESESGARYEDAVIARDATSLLLTVRTDVVAEARTCAEEQECPENGEQAGAPPAEFKKVAPAHSALWMVQHGCHAAAKLVSRSESRRCSQQDRLRPQLTQSLVTLAGCKSGGGV